MREGILVKWLEAALVATIALTILAAFMAMAAMMFVIVWHLFTQTF